MSLWGELRDVLYERMLLESRHELARNELLNPDDVEYDGEAEFRDKEQEEVMQRIRKLEEEVSRLQLDEVVKDRISFAALTGREVSNAVYGLKADASPASIVKLRYAMPPSRKK